MSLQKITVLLGLALFVAGCNSNSCDFNKASNKMLALSKVQGRLVAKGGDSGMGLSSAMAIETAPIHVLIAEKKYDEACAKAEEIAKKYGMDLANEQKDMITMEQLAADGGKGSGTCSIADAAKKQMEVRGLLQKEVDAGRADSSVFREFNDETREFAELLSTNPSKACDLLDRVKEKHNLK